jgi:hypothetical protein
LAPAGRVGKTAGGPERRSAGEADAVFAAEAAPTSYLRPLNPALQSFDAWLGANASRIPLG